jgi:hypothetical protein
MDTVENAKSLLDIETRELEEVQGDMQEQLKNVSDLLNFTSPVYYNKNNIVFLDPQLYGHFTTKFPKLQLLIALDLPGFNSSVFVCDHTNCPEINSILN